MCCTHSPSHQKSQYILPSHGSDWSLSSQETSYKSNQQTVCTNQHVESRHAEKWEDLQSSICNLFKMYPLVNIRTATEGTTTAIVIAVVTHIPCVEYPLASGSIGTIPGGGTPAGQILGSMVVGSRQASMANQLRAFAQTNDSRHERGADCKCQPRVKADESLQISSGECFSNTPCR